MSGRGVAALVRGWVDLYTRGLPAAVRAARRDEVDDDLWCQHEEAALLGRSVRSLGREILLRLVLGMPSDLSWRVSHGGRASKVERSSSMRTRIIGSLGVIAGAGFTYLSARAITTPGDAMWNGTDGMITVVAFLGGGVAFVGAAIGLIWRFQDELRPLGVIGGLVASLSTLVGVIASDAPVALLGLPIGSAMLAWDLSRAGILPRWLAVVHALGAIGFAATLIGTLTDYETAIMNAGLIAVSIPYLLSWIAIGAWVLRGVPRTAALGS
jgi:hypothetical protein